MKKRSIKIYGNGIMPEYASELSSGGDVRTIEEFTLKPMERKLVHTGIHFILPPDVEVQIRPRSGLAVKHGITVLNAPGTIDADYRGECCVVLINLGDKEVKFEKYDRIAQFVFVENVFQAEFEDVKIGEMIPTTERGEGGFGHTGVK